MNKKKKLLLLLQQNYGGTLPPGFTELEYLESSGTQYIDTDYIPNNETGLRLSLLTWSVTDTIPFGCRNSATTQTRVIAPRPRIQQEENANYWGFGWGTWTGIYIDKSFRHKPWTSWLNWQNGREARAEIETSIYTDTLPPLTFDPAFSLYLFSANIGSVASYPYAGKITAAGISQGEKIVHDFVPVLNAAGEPGMWDKVSKRFFGNAGTGTFGYRVKSTGEVVAPRMFSLRDPYYVAPSGVYARLVAENELDVTADPDMAADIAEQYGYTWFANTADAYEHFGIVPGDPEQLPN